MAFHQRCAIGMCNFCSGQQRTDAVARMSCGDTGVAIVIVKKPDQGVIGKGPPFPRLVCERVPRIVAGVLGSLKSIYFASSIAI